ncbi:flagellar basal body-associated FliL family protein [Roseovarius pelagicus]|uniref:Flagellar protein FliL n=1 Tax=Roseovarius pelagicus TaxID=2980108 RepID=A0ABY6D809_9RHOB|nr:flagellar basal body-associated FliL family protein [Roseovarius pelagicus]UXX82272.1 flagellar basal body-associated FliL family protein [Roseovarius pelagicus]
MADKDHKDDETRGKPSKLPLILGVGLALAGGGGGFFAANTGLILAPESGGHDLTVTGTHDEHAKGHTQKTMPDIAYVPVDALVISLGDGATGAHLRFRAQLEVASQYRQEVETLMPRVVDVLNSYLRALETRDLADSTALVRLRAQMLRRIQIVTGAERVNDLLIMEFVLN